MLCSYKSKIHRNQHVLIKFYNKTPSRFTMAGQQCTTWRLTILPLLDFIYVCIIIYLNVGGRNLPFHIIMDLVTKKCSKLDNYHPIETYELATSCTTLQIFS